MPSKARPQHSSQDELSILQAQEKKGQTREGVRTGGGGICTPDWKPFLERETGLSRHTVVRARKRQPVHPRSLRLLRMLVRRVPLLKRWRPALPTWLHWL